MSNARVAGQGSPWFEQPVDCLRKRLPQWGKLVAPGGITQGKINGARSNSVLQIAEVAVVN